MNTEIYYSHRLRVGVCSNCAANAITNTHKDSELAADWRL